VLRSDYAADHLHVSYVCRPSTAGRGRHARSRVGR
jgi:hypothetical protein